MDHGYDYREIRGKIRITSELSFSTDRKYMAVTTEDPDGHKYLYVKGAPEIVLALCQDGESEADRTTIDNILTGYQEKAMRTLGFAYQEIHDDMECISDGRIIVSRLKFCGITAISDPIRTDVPQSISRCLDAGISIKIVTGDTPGTAKEIGRQIGLWNDGDGDRNIITGQEFGHLSDKDLDEHVLDYKIIARARPLDKKRLVESLQRIGEVVAVTGDGTNDAPALKAAHVGLSMGDGTAVAKEASDITIVDNSFASIGRSVMWGRSLYKNIQRFIMFQLTVNVAACLIVLIGAFIGTESPLTVTQMLWVNLIMDTFAAMALASLPPSESVMNKPPRSRHSFIIGKAMWLNILATGVLFFVILYCLLYIFLHSDITSLTDLIHLHLQQKDRLTPYELSLLFTTFVMLQFWNMFNARAFSTNRSALHLRDCGEFIFIATIIFVGQILIVEVGGDFFNVVPISLSDWITIIFSTSIVLWIGELGRYLTHKSNRS